MGPLQNNIVI